ncbi:MAG TPA: DUF11 domain-containing protein [Pyrinomonadaceae bacterium]|nr:DUF11 domain-containing protein [Pyrinomonadaceae bacterium]
MKNYRHNQPSARPHGGQKRLVRYTAAAFLAVASVALWPGLLERVGLGGVSRAFDLSNEKVTVFAGDCRTPQTTFYLGDTVCVLVSDSALPDNGAVYRRLQWAAPDISEGQRTDIMTDQQYERFAIPTSGPLAQVGKWTVQTIDVSANGYAVANFTVRSPSFAYVDFVIRRDGPPSVVPGDYLEYTITVSNNGPEYAKDVNFVDYMPTNTTFAALKQLSGIPFRCSTPERGTVGKTVCTGFEMRPEDSATFVVYYYVDPNTREGTVFSSSNEVWGANPELNKRDNFCESESTAMYPVKEIDPEPEP